MSASDFAPLREWVIEMTVHGVAKHSHAHLVDRLLREHAERGEALARIEATGFEFAADEMERLDGRAALRFETLANIAVEGLYPKSDDDEIDCRSIPQ